MSRGRSRLRSQRRCACSAFENKVQAILLIGALPLLILPFGNAASASVPFWRRARTGLACGGGCGPRDDRRGMGWPGRLIATGFDRALLDAAQIPPAAGWAATASIRRRCLALIVRLHDRLCRDLAHQRGRDAGVDRQPSLAGASIALLALNLEYNAGNVIAVINPLEKMLAFADVSGTDAATGSSAIGMLVLLLEGIAIRSGALQFRAALLAASDGISDLADRSRHRLWRGGAANGRRRSRL